MAKIKAFTLRHKKSKAGKDYFVSPLGDIDLLGFITAAGDIEVSYVERESARPSAGPPRAPQPQARPKIIPRESRPTITPRQEPPHQDPPGEMDPSLPDWMNEPFVPDDQGY